MQLTSQNNAFMEFKDEVFKKMRLIENKFISELNSKLSKVNSIFEKMEVRINTVSQNNNYLLDLFTKQKFNFEKFNQFDIYKIKTDKILTTQKIQINNILQEIAQMKEKQEKIVEENLILPGYVGPCSRFKNLSDCLIHELEEFNKFRNDFEQNKNKYEDIEKNSVNIISKAFFTFQSFSNNKNNQMTALLEKKLDNYNSKILELETQMGIFQPKIDKYIKSMQNEIQKVIKARNTFYEDEGKKFEEFNQKINSLRQDFENFKNTKFQFLNITKENNFTKEKNFFDSSKTISRNIKYPNDNKIIYKTNKNARITNFKNKLKERNKNNDRSINDADKKNSSIIYNNNNENFSQVFSEAASPKRKHTSSKFINNEYNYINEEIKSPFYSEKFRREQIFKKEINNQPFLTIKKIDTIKLNDKKFSDKTIATNSNILSNEKNFIEENKNNKRYIGKISNDNISLKKNHNKESEKNLMKYNEPINKEQNINNIIDNKKIQTKSVNKQKGEIKSNNIPLKVHELTSDKNELNEQVIKHKKLNKINSRDNFQKTERKEIENRDIIIISSKNSSFSSSEEKQINTKEKNNNIELKNKDNTNLKSFIPLKNYTTTNNASARIAISSPKNIKIDIKTSVNIEQQKIMSKIREYYNNRQKQTERRSNEKAINCNLINLNLRPLSKVKRHSFHSHSRNTFYTINGSKTNKIRNFGKTNSIFYSKRERYSFTKSLNNLYN